MSTELTDKKLWSEYWRDKSPQPISKVYFEEFLKYFPENGSLIEIGGFPGIYAGYFKKRFDYDVTILDYVIEASVIHEIEELYALEKGSLTVLHKNFLEFNPEKKFDIVTSFGFIEHFEDIEGILRKHIELLSDKGVLLVTVPNFLGLNGFIQKKLDKRNYNIHNLRAMDIDYLKSTLKIFRLNEFHIKYIGKPNVWLEDDADVSITERHSIKILGRLIRKIPIKNNKFFSPHIIIVAKK